MGTMRIACKQGDISVSWNPDDRESIERAKAEFDRLKADGYEFFSEGKRVKGWSPKRGSVLAVPGVQRKADKAVAPRAPAPRRQKAMAGGPIAGLR